MASSGVEVEGTESDARTNQDPMVRTESGQPQTPELTRRRWLGHVGLGLGLAGLVGLGGIGYALSRRQGSVASATIRDFRVIAPDSTPTMVIARGPSVTKNLRGALHAMGGLRPFVGPDDIVLIKPNIGWERRPEQAATTNPELVAALVGACREAGARQVLVADTPVNDAKACFARSGIAAAARQAGARVILPSEAGSCNVSIAGSPDVYPALGIIRDVTKLINVPIAKHHGATLGTAGMKNLFGLLTSRRDRLHARMNESIVSVAKRFRPTLTVIDATRVLLRNGPKGGNLDDVKLLHSLAISVDPVAADAWAAAQLGLNASQIRYLALAEEHHLGNADYRSLKPVEITA